MSSFVTPAAFSITSRMLEEGGISFSLLITPGGIFKLRSHNLNPEDINWDFSTLKQILYHYKSS